ncbi:MAG TPA: large conductance mechanosensitive channel protein MscL [Gemmatimonadales bacterium]|nr:large conductance mechanosensitive channel protein MscL [Gemmatimonadales bacterium]
MMLKEFRAFILRGNVLDLAVGVIIGAAFGAIVTSLVNDVIMPPIGLALGSVDFKDLFVVLKDGATAGPYASLAAAREAGAVTLNSGAFVNTIVSVLIVGFSIFLVVRAANRLHQKPAAPPPPPTKECPFCCSSVAVKATRCPNCTSELKAA